MSLNCSSQLQVLTNNNATALAQAILGSGITVTNAQLKGGSFASGTFNYSGNNLAIKKGILLTTGSVANVANPGTYFCNISNNNNFTDPDITAISPRAKYDVCMLEFDFVPICDTLRIDYTFGSEEYPQSVYQTYNDVFALFLSGPNPNGGNYTSKNIALLPNKSTPVSIDSINGGWPIGVNSSHSEYYIDNYTNPNSEIAFDGYTTPVFSKAALIPCKLYHLKIAIADGGNSKYDSGVFIKGASFACNNIPVISSSTLSSCKNGGIIALNVANTSAIPSYTWFPGGEHSDSLKQVAAGSYTCEINVPGTCSNFTVTATIPQPSTVNINTASQFVCKGKGLQLNASGAKTYNWLPAAYLSNSAVANPIAKPEVTTTYTLTGTGTDGCVNKAMITLSTSPLAFKADFDASRFETSIDSTLIQFYDRSEQAANWHWNFGDGSGDGIANPGHVFITAGNFYVTLTTSDKNNCRDSISKKVIINDILKELFTFYVPNSFTPNGDGLNDEFMPLGYGWDEAHYSFELFDAWGRSIFASSHPYQAWNGKIKNGEVAKNGVYTWKVDVKDVYRNYHHYVGNVNLLR